MTIPTRTMGRFSALAFWCVLAALAAVPEALAQYRFDSWTTENGLPHKAVHSLLQTRDGYLWLTTTDGLEGSDETVLGMGLSIEKVFKRLPPPSVP